MKFMRSLVVFILIWINLDVIGINFWFSFIETFGKKESKENDSYNLRRIKEKQIIQNPNNLNEASNVPRNLKVNEFELYIFYLNISSMLFVIILSISYLLKPNECCDCECCGEKCVKACLNPDIDCDSDAGGEGCDCIGQLIGYCLLLAFYYIFAFIFLGIIFLFKIIGKHIWRIISVLSLFIIELIIGIMALISEKDLNIYIIASASFIGAICNLLGFVLPFFMDKFRYDYM